MALSPTSSHGGSLIAGSPVVVNNAGIKALPTTNLPEIIAAPGANKIAIPTLIVIRTSFSVAYNGIDADGSDLSFYWDDGSSSVQWSNPIINSAALSFNLIDFTALLTTTTARNVLMTTAKIVQLDSTGTAAQARQANNDDSVMVNAHLILSVTNSIAFGGGAAGNTMTIIPYYVVLSV